MKQVQLHCGLIVLAAVLVACAIVHSPVHAARSADQHTDRIPRLPLDTIIAEQSLVGFEPVTPHRIPNYIRVFEVINNDAPAAMANMARSILYDGKVEPDLKMAMGLAVASLDQSPYTTAHMSRLLGATERGRTLQQAVESNLSALNDADRLAIEYARALTQDVKGFDDDSFNELRVHYNEPQIIELTLVACFFSFFNRIVEPLNLPIESWATKPAEKRGIHGTYDEPVARVGLLSDEEVRVIARRLEADASTSSFGVKVPNSVRAMARVSDIQGAWWRLWSVTTKDSEIGELLQHYISNEVSYRNDCYYCITHQVYKLHDAGIPVQAIARAADSPDALPDRERQAVMFARQVTDDPTSIVHHEFEELIETFSERGAFEILLVTARFNFMNRFTSGLGLPSEPRPIEVYLRVEAERRN